MLALFADYAYNVRSHCKRKEDVLKEERNIQGEIAIVTGSNHGIGKQTALELAQRGAEVVMACRDIIKAEKAKEEILKQVPNAKLVLMSLDLTDLSSVRSFAEEVKQKYNHIHILINNAGIYQFVEALAKTKDGFESHIGVNHLGHFLLTLLLLDLLKKADKARIVVVSSMIMKMAKLDVSNLNMDGVSLKSKTHLPYSNSKMANALFVKELSKRLKNSNVTAYALCPGAVYVYDINDVPWYSRWLIQLSLKTFMFDVKDGAGTTLYCALDKRLDQESGKFYRLLGVWNEVDELIEEDQAAALWTVSEKLVGL